MAEVVELLGEGELALAEAPVGEVDRHFLHVRARALDQQFQADLVAHGIQIARLLEAALFADTNECNTIIPAARMTSGQTKDELLDAIEEGKKAYDQKARQKFAAGGE